MAAFSSPLKIVSLALFLVVGGSAVAYADEPSPAALEAARAIIADWGMTQSFDRVVPEMLAQLERNVLKTRPELKDSLHATLLAIKPEFDKTELTLVASAAEALAKQMSEQELKDTAAFFQTPSGKKYIETEPGAITQILTLVQNWREQLSVQVLSRAHEEMKKKGTDF